MGFEERSNFVPCPPLQRTLVGFTSKRRGGNFCRGVVLGKAAMNTGWFAEENNQKNQTTCTALNPTNCNYNKYLAWAWHLLLCDLARPRAAWLVK
jgi:hypothetical protein